MKLRMLGVSQIELGTRDVRPTATHLFSLLLYVALERGRVISRTELASQLFPGINESDSSHSLRQLLYRAKGIGAPLVVLKSDVHVVPDAVEDEICTLLASGRVANKYLKSGHLSILPHFEPPTPPLCPWLERYRDRVRLELIHLLAADLHAARTRADWRLVADISTSLLELDPLNETATLSAAEALARLGSKH